MAVIKHFLRNVKTFLISIIMGNCCCRKSSARSISVLLLGTGESGKTEIAHALSGEPRIDFGSTKGVHVFNVNSRCQTVKVTEIGGSDSVRDIWPHYYNDAFGVIFVIDCSLQAPFDLMREVLHNVMHNKHIRGKPLLIVANKQDLEQSIDVVDITYFFRIDELCNTLGTPCRIITSGMADRSDLHIGMDWLIEIIFENYRSLKNRIRFNDLLSTPLKRFDRQRTSLPRAGAAVIHNRRIRSAPSKVTDKRTPNPKPNGPLNGSKIHNRLQQITPVHPMTPAASSPESAIFRLNTIVVRHE